MAELGQNIFDAIDELETLVTDAKAPAMFGTGKKVIDEEDVFHVVDDMRQLIPQEIIAANAKMAEAEGRLVQANMQADSIIEEAQARAVEIGAQQEVVRLAQQQADDIRRTALSEANSIKEQADAYAASTRSKADQEASEIEGRAIQHANELIRKAQDKATTMIESARQEALDTVMAARQEASSLVNDVDSFIADTQSSMRALAESLSQSGQGVNKARKASRQLIAAKLQDLEAPVASIED